MNNFTIDSESKLRSEEALRFYDSSERLQWTEHRIVNDEDSIITSISLGIEKMKNGRAKEVIDILAEL